MSDRRLRLLSRLSLVFLGISFTLLVVEVFATDLYPQLRFWEADGLDRHNGLALKLYADSVWPVPPLHKSLQLIQNIATLIFLGLSWTVVVVRVRRWYRTGRAWRGKTRPLGKPIDLDDA